jgi:hypothetical protein
VAWAAGVSGTALVDVVVNGLLNAIRIASIATSTPKKASGGEHPIFIA